MMQNLAREICKDITDIPGDRKIFVKSIPMKYGLNMTKRIIGVILITQIACLITFTELFNFWLEDWAFSILLIALSLNIIIIILMANNELFLKFSQALLKLSMLIGLSALFI